MFVRSLHKEREGERGRGQRGEMKKRGARGKDANARSLPLSSSPSFGHSTTYAEVGRRTREREKKIYIERGKKLRTIRNTAV